MSGPSYFSSAVEVFTLFLIPIGGGIPAGVVLGQARGVEWPMMALLYFLSDIVLAFTFEPVMHLFLRLAKHSPFLTRFMEEYKRSLERMGAKFQTGLGPFALIMVAFGVDPMTGRAAAKASGHGFISGWALAITGDMIFFFLIMGSTLWLNNILGDGTWTAIIIMIAMIGIPALIRRWKASRTRA